MVGKTLDFESFIHPDMLGTSMSNKWITWNTLRAKKIATWEEVRKYVFATDTSQSSNAALPWKNTTTIPKLCQIRDNLAANYMQSIFPKRNWLEWEGETPEANTPDKREAIISYMSYVVDQIPFKGEVEKLVMDFIDYGNAFVMPDWKDNTLLGETKNQLGYVGPTVRRISPHDIVFDPTANSFTETPKIVRSVLSRGQVKKQIDNFAQRTGNETWYKDLWDYLKEIRALTANYTDVSEYPKDSIYQIQGFSNYRDYLTSDFVELLTFYGDYYDEEEDKLYENHIVIVADRHKVIYKEPNPSYFDYPPIWHVGWRQEQDNLWAMGPLENLVGMQYRIDHIENLKADAFDLSTFPVFKIKGYVENFKWEPMAKIYTGDDGDVTLLTPDIQILQVNSEIMNLEAKMEEMAGAPKEALGFRTPGEKTAFEVQRLENAASRIFNSKISMFEEKLIENVLNGCLELGRRNFSGGPSKIFDEEYKMKTFVELSAEDIVGAGRLKPVAARHFAEKAEIVQNLNNLFTSPLGQNPAFMMHVSMTRLGEMIENLLGLEDYKLFQRYVQISEATDAQRLQQVAQEQTQMEAQTPSGLNEDDYDEGVEPDDMEEDPNAEEEAGAGANPFQ